MKFTNQSKLVRGVQAAIAVVRGSPPVSIAVLCGCLMLAQLATAQVHNPIDTIAGPGRPAPFGDGGPALAATLTLPTDIAVDSQGNVYFSEPTISHRVRRIDVESGIISTVAGTGERGYSGDGGPATSAELGTPFGLAVDALDNLYVADVAYAVVRRVDVTTGIISTVAGTGERGLAGDGGPATSAKLGYPFGLAADSLGNLYIPDYFYHVVRRVDFATGTISTVAGTPRKRGYSGDGGPATSALMRNPWKLTVDGLGNLYISDRNNHVVRRVDATTGTISTVAGTGRRGFTGDGGPATSAMFSHPCGVAVDGLGNLYISDRSNYRVRVVDSSGNIRTLAGSSTRAGFGGDGGPAAYSELSQVSGLAADGFGNLYIVDEFNHRIRRVATGQVHSPIDTVAGRGRTAPFGDGGPARSATLTQPYLVAADSHGNVYFSERNNHRVRRIDLESGTISTVAGTGEPGFSGDGGPAVSARIWAPRGLALDSLDNLYINGHNRVRRVNAASGIIETVAGTGRRGYSGDGGPATSALMINGQGIAVDSLGNLYIPANNGVRRVDAASGVISTIVGPGHPPGFSGDGGPATSATLYTPIDVAVDGLGNLYIADSRNHRVRVVDSSGTIRTLAGSSSRPRFAGDGGPAAFSELSRVYGVAVDDFGNLYIADTDNHRIRRVRLTQ